MLSGDWVFGFADTALHSGFLSLRDKMKLKNQRKRRVNMVWQEVIKGWEFKRLEKGETIEGIFEGFAEIRGRERPRIVTGDTVVILPDHVNLVNKLRGLEGSVVKILLHDITKRKGRTFYVYRVFKRVSDHDGEDDK